MRTQGDDLNKLMVKVKLYLDEFYTQLLHDNVSIHSQLPQLENGFRYEFKILQQNVQEYTEQIDVLLTLLPKWRAKRGLVDAGGHVLKYLLEPWTALT